MLRKFRNRFVWLFSNLHSLRFLDDPPVGVAEPPAAPPAELPEWLNGPEYEELIKDEGNKNILSRFESVDAAVKAGLEHKKLLSSNFRLPDKLNDEQAKELLGRMAQINKVPENAEGYTLQRPEEIDEKFDISEEAKMKFRAFAKEKNFSPEVTQAGYEMLVRMSSEANSVVMEAFEKDQKDRNEKTVTQMKQYLGPAEYEKRVDLIEEYAKSRALDDAEYDGLQEELERTGMRNNALLFKMFADAAHYYEILEKNAGVGIEGYQPGRGNKTITKEQKRATMYPNTPKHLGGGKPD